MKLLFICALAALVVPQRASAAEREGRAIERDYELLCESSSVKLFVDKETLSLKVEDKATGSFMESAVSYDDGRNNATWLGSMQSPVVMTLISGADDTKQADMINDNVIKKVQYTATGFSADLSWPSYGISMTLNVELSDDGLVVSVPDQSIAENNDNFYIGTIALYPYMGVSYLDDKEGYLFLPDGNGALIYLNDKEGRFSTGFTSYIYGSDVGFDELQVKTLLWDRYDTLQDAERVLAPIFGIAHTDDKMAYLGIVEQGTARATVNAIPNGANVDYNRAFARFILRRMYTQPTSNNSSTGSIRMVEPERSHSDLSVRFLYLSGDKANYAGMAGAYRDYLIKNGGLSVSDTSYRTRVDFLGTEREQWVLGTTPVVMTTVDDIRDIYDDLDSRGVGDVLSVYKGWQKGGLYDLPITRYKADARIGGTGALTRLIQDSEAKGKKLYLYNDALIINPDEQNATFHVAKQVNKRRYVFETYKDVYEEFLYLTPTRSRDLLSRFVKSYTSKGVKNLALAGITDTLFTYTYSGAQYSRHESMTVTDQAIEDTAAQTELILEQPVAAFWRYAGAFLDMPLYTSNYILEDESVPFLSIALSGVMPVYAEYVNFEANKQEFFLKMVEADSFPSFYITKEDSAKLIYTNSNDIYSSQYDAYRDTIAEYDARLKEFHSHVAGASITSHRIGEDGVTEVGYSNGATVYINYTNEDKTIDGAAVRAMDFAVTD